VRDPYWTLIGYFNSLRILAAAELQVQDDVRQSIDILAARDGIRDGISRDARRPDAVSELTSRVKSSEIPRRLKDLERALGNDPFDVVLATNMISVGVDVDRLGLMAVMGQPQMTAEYIQATSRIGRSHPGLAVVMYNASRSRDRSHYESFAAYHGALYRQVESTSVTPFASRARDRALHAAFIGAARMLYPQARDNTSAAAVETFTKELEVLRERFLDRVRAVAPREADATANDLEYVIEDWKAMATANEELVYEAKRRSQFNPVPRPDEAALLRTHSDDDLQDAWPTLWSLRDVDVEADLYLEN
jgi:superfamily II DNA or RNA helicase